MAKGEAGCCRQPLTPGPMAFPLNHTICCLSSAVHTPVRSQFSVCPVEPALGKQVPTCSFQWSAVYGACGFKGSVLDLVAACVFLRVNAAGAYSSLRSRLSCPILSSPSQLHRLHCPGGIAVLPQQKEDQKAGKRPFSSSLVPRVCCWRLWFWEPVCTFGGRTVKCQIWSLPDTTPTGTSLQLSIHSVHNPSPGFLLIWVAFSNRPSPSPS